MSLKFEKPPVATRRSGGAARIDEEVKQLQSKPGEWAKLRDGAASGNYTTYKKRGVLTRVKGVGHNRYDIWGVWLGTEEDPTTVAAALIEPGIVIVHPTTGSPVEVRDVTVNTSEEKVLLEVFSRGKVRRVRVSIDHEVTCMGVA